MQKDKHRLRHILCAVFRHIADDDAPFPRRLHIHDVISRRGHADVTQVQQRGNDPAIDDRLIRQYNRRALQPAHHLIRAGALKDFKVAELFKFIPAQVARVGGMAIENHNFHGIRRIIVAREQHVTRNDRQQRAWHACVTPACVIAMVAVPAMDC